MASSIINSDDGVVSGTSGLKTTGGDDGVLVFQSKGTETARITTSGTLQLTDDLTFTGTGNRITGDMSNATAANRVSFQSSTTNGATLLQVLPNGTATTSGFIVSQTSDTTSTGSFGFLYSTSAEFRLTSGVWSGSSYLPMTFYTGGSEIARFTETGGYFRMASGTGGIQFGGDTAAANALNDYEEGTWTPGVTFGGASAGVTYTGNNSGTYTKIGRLVFITGNLELSSKGSSTGDVLITGLPFTVLATSNSNFGGVTIATFLATYTGIPALRTYSGETTIIVAENSEAGVLSNITNADFSNNTQIRFSCCYQT